MRQTLTSSGEIYLVYTFHVEKYKINLWPYLFFVFQFLLSKASFFCPERCITNVVATCFVVHVQNVKLCSFCFLAFTCLFFERAINSMNFDSSNSRVVSVEGEGSWTQGWHLVSFFSLLYNILVGFRPYDNCAVLC